MLFVCGQEDPHPDDVEYYYDDKTDPALKSRVDENYGENYEVEERKAVANKTAPEPIVAYMPELKDYTLNPAFADPFKSLPQVSITAVCKHGWNLAASGCLWATVSIVRTY